MSDIYDIAKPHVSADIRLVECCHLAMRILHEYRDLAGRIMTDPDYSERFNLWNFPEKIRDYYSMISDLGLEGDVARSQFQHGKIEGNVLEYIGNWKGRARFKGFKKANDKAVREGWITKAQGKKAIEEFLRKYKAEDEEADMKYCYEFGCRYFGKQEFEEACEMFGVEVGTRKVVIE